MLDISLKKLEFDKIQNTLMNYCQTEIGKELSLKLCPSSSSLEVESLLCQTNDCLFILNTSGNPPIIPMENISLACKKLESGQTLSIKQLYNIAVVLKISRQLKKYFSDNTEGNFSLKTQDLFSLIYTNPGIEKDIFDSIIDENTVSDEASSELSKIRRTQKKLESSIKSKLTDMVHSSHYTRYLMDTVITIRNDRYVIPVKGEYQDKIKGFIHDTSASGSTIYIEPLSVFEMNNEIARLKLQEIEEIERILKNLCLRLFPIHSNLKKNQELIGQIDFIFAKAKYAKDTSSIFPKLNKKKQIHLNKARHPLLR